MQFATSSPPHCAVLSLLSWLPQNQYQEHEQILVENCKWSCAITRFPVPISDSNSSTHVILQPALYIMLGFLADSVIDLIQIGSSYIDLVYCLIHSVQRWCAFYVPHNCYHCLSSIPTMSGHKKIRIWANQLPWYIVINFPSHYQTMHELLNGAKSCVAYIFWRNFSFIRYAYWTTLFFSGMNSSSFGTSSPDIHALLTNFMDNSESSIDTYYSLQRSSRR